MVVEHADGDLPFEKSWWIDPGRIIGGPYPGDRNAATRDEKLAGLLDVGVRTVVNLQDPNELGQGDTRFEDYIPRLAELAARRGLAVTARRFPVTDMGVPTPERMSDILRAIDDGLAGGGRVYVHCWGGHGRTGTVAGCWHVGCGKTADQAFAAITAAREHDRHLVGMGSPQDARQFAFIRDWAGRQNKKGRE